MNSKLLAAAIFLFTFCAIGAYPALQSNFGQRHTLDDDPVDIAAVPPDRPVVDVVFVLDTTGSMSGLIQTAKDKIWSIASTMASAEPTPALRIGLVGYRDRGDAYVTRKVDLSQDLDSVYAELMRFEAGGGGDTPESVNEALHEAVHGMSWTGQAQAYRVIFLVGDAPPHMDYQDEPQYPEIVASAREKGIVVNTIQCGTMAITTSPWDAIARLGAGSYHRVEQAGGAVAYATPYDAEIAELTAKLDATRLYYGTGKDRERLEAKLRAIEEITVTGSAQARARRGVFNSSAAGRDNALEDRDLVAGVMSGSVDLEAIEPEALPEAVKPMAPAEQRAYIEKLAGEREELESRIRELADERASYLESKVEEEGGRADSLDRKIYETVSRQAAEAGLVYKDGPAY